MERLAYNLISFASQVDQNTIEQAKQTARMPFVYPHVALMPDAHFGKGSSVGTVIPTKGAVIPAAVGVDIGCGMIAVKTRFDIEDINAKTPTSGLHRLREMIEDAIPVSPGVYNQNIKRFPFTAAKHEKLLKLQEVLKVDLKHSPKWMQQLGSLGGGNHFIELCLDDEDNVWLFLHSGSRGVGNKIATHHIKVAEKYCEDNVWLPSRDLAFLEQGTPEFDRYLYDLNWAQEFALLNRDEMMDRFIWVFARWLGVESQRVELERINCHHNYTTPVTIEGERVWLTRKGAIDASEGKLGVIPGSMGTRSYVVRGKSNQTSLYSAAHGAGRKFSRNQAKKLFTEEDLAKRMEGIEYRHGPEFIDEIPDAYKDIDQIMEDSKDMVEVITTLRQLLNVKGV
jgi:tRNA-splicing ligase RtcB (3'-phosphate/5'-hydroxy nucleic acid ligase)